MYSSIKSGIASNNPKITSSGGLNFDVIARISSSDEYLLLSSLVRLLCKINRANQFFPIYSQKESQKLLSRSNSPISFPRISINVSV